MKIVVLDAATLGTDTDLSPLFACGDVTVYPGTAPEEITARIADTDVIVSNKLKLNRSNLENAKKLKLICLTATGYDCVDVGYCRTRGIGVCNVPGYSTQSVAQLTLTLVLALTANLSSYREFVHTGGYTRSGVANSLEPVWHELYGKTWGVVGGGNIGQQVARVAEAFGCRVLMCRRNPDPRYENVDIDTLCERADVISIHVPLTEQTRGMIGQAQIRRMQSHAVLVNVARGAVTDEAALADAVLEGRIAGLGVDVYSVEPFGEDHPFQRILDRENVILTPHMAWGAYETRNRCVAMVAENIEVWKAGGVKNRVE